MWKDEVLSFPVIKLREKGFHGMKMFTLTFGIAAALTLAASSAVAITTIDFDQLQVGEDVLNYYNGGVGSLGSGPGPSDGAIFSAGWVVSGPDVYGALGGKSAAISGTAVLNVPSGWFGPTSFYYTGGSLTVTFYSEQNGLGSVLATLTESGASMFSPAGLALPLFQSAVFLAPTGDRIDALTNGGFVVPEPGTLQLFLFAGCFLRFASPLRRRH